MEYTQKNRTIIIVCLVTILASVIVMAGWIFDKAALQSIVPGFEGMRFNPALCFILFSSALLVTQYPSIKNGAAIYFILSLLGTCIGLLTLSQDVFHVNLGIDQLFITDKTIPSYSFPFPGRMAFNASVNFVLLGLGFLGLTLKKRFFDILSQSAFNIVTIGYLYGVSFFRVVLYETSMATHTAILFFILSLGASLLHPSIGITGLFTGKQVGNQMAKRLSILMALMVVLFGSVKLQTGHLRLFSSLDIGVSLLAVCFLLVSLLLIWNTANWLNGIDKKRSEAEAEVKRMNTGLEKMVEERSAEIQKSEEKYRSLIEQASDAIYMLDINGNFTDANESMCKMVGYRCEELLTMNVESIIDPGEVKVDPPLTNIRLLKDAIIRERKFMRRNGEVFNVEINVKRFSDDRIMVIARDITGRKKMETELREAELKFRTIADKSIVGVYIVQKGKFTYVNPRFAEVFGYGPEEMINTFLLEFVFDESFRATASENVRKRVAGEVESVHYEAMGKKKDGTTNWVEFYGSRAIIGNEPTIIGSMIDITKRKKAEEELRSSEQKYKLLFESNPMPMWMIAKDDLSIIAVNDVAASHYGYTKDELLNSSVKVLRPPEDIEKQTESFSRDINYASEPDIVKHLKKDGSAIFVQLIAQDITFEGRRVRLAMTNDITEKLEAEELLKKSEANLQTILKTTDTAYALFDLNLKLLAFNQKADEFVKEHYTHTPAKGDHLADYFPKERFPQFADYARTVLSGNNINYEIDYPKTDRTVFWYHVRLFPITNDNKEILGLLMALYDITERKNAEQNLKNAYGHIQNHINSIKDMAWKQSHLIRSPLANLKGLIAILKEDPSEPLLFEHIEKELNRMDAILIEMANEASEHDDDE
jgi:two-component system, sporulation sensor kinase E